MLNVYKAKHESMKHKSWNEKIEHMKKAKERVYKRRSFFKTLALALGIAVLIVGCTFGVSSLSETASAKEKPIETLNEDGYVYVIVDIVSYVYNADNEGNTDLYCVMQNGKDVEIYTITDAPEDKCTIACLRTKNLDDYTTYEVVAVR